MAKIESYRELQVFQTSMSGATRIFPHARALPKFERYELQSQILSSSRAVPALLAEAWARRRYRRAFQEKLSQALAEATETEVWLAIMKNCGYLAEDECEALTEVYRHICAMIMTMIIKADRFTPPSPE